MRNRVGSELVSNFHWERAPGLNGCWSVYRTPLAGSAGTPQEGRRRLRKTASMFIDGAPKAGAQPESRTYGAVGALCVLSRSVVATGPLPAVPHGGIDTPITGNTLQLM